MLAILSEVFRLSAILFVMVFLLFILLKEKQSANKNILLLFLLSVASYLLAYWDMIKPIAYFYDLVFLGAVFLPYFFWLLSKSLFDDEFQWNLKYYLSLIFPFTNYILYRLNGSELASSIEFIRFIPYLISGSFIALVIYESLKNRNNDLLLSRLLKRNVFVVIASLMALVTIYFFFFEDPLNLPRTFEFIQNLSICVFLILFLFGQFDWKPIFEKAKTQESQTNTQTSNNQKNLINKLLDIFDKELLYTKEGLTITELSQILNEKEYLIRRAINGELGYINFNNFLNHYRIKRACLLISENTDKKLTFQEIAFNLGYQSIATFNRAFKKETGYTPSEYARRENI